ncbi:hypothetical protein SDC9_87827 [bioreactor metagenome]|uniref:Uncharacterized protein n=1 Tax=bioreactor metagenome TaxID=1076179 RepID=A0A644ZKC7_9ZZZZ
MDTAHSDSISIPVCPTVLAVAVISTLLFSKSSEKFISHPVIIIGWHIGIMSDVFFAPIIPAT